MTYQSNNAINYPLILNVLILFRHVICDSYRLPGTVIPKHYVLKIITNVEDDLVYTGNLEIVIQCLNVTDKISLHRDLGTQLDKIEVKEIETVQNYKPGPEVALKEILYSNKMEFLMITTMENLKVDQHYIMYFEFTGNLSQTPSGIHRASFESSSGTNFYVLSIFEPMGARKTFPCFDEPGMTASFEVNIGRKEKYNTTSNMQLVKSEPMEDKDGWYWDHFLNSFPMSTYLVCFMIYDSEFTWIGEQEDQMKMLVRKEMRSSMQMITKTGPKLLAHLQKYFQMPFPFPKLDIVVLPNAMGEKASMSTPGLIVLQEKLLFYEPFNMKHSDAQEVLYKVAEAMSFQWMSVVAVDWWSEVWFGTSLAKYNAREALTELSGSNLMEIYEPADLLHFFHFPKKLSVSEQVFGDLASVSASLSSVDYTKCELLFRMAVSFSNKKSIKQITSTFLKKNSFQKVEKEDLWGMFKNFVPQGVLRQEVSLGDVMAEWMTHNGYPEIEVIRDYTAGTANLNQKNKEEDSCWWIPITYSVKSEHENMNTNVQKWLRCPNETSQLESIPKSDWLLLNVNFSALYRVNYDVQNWKFLHSTLENPMSYRHIPTLNRMQLIDDAFEFTTRGNLSYDFLFDFAEYLRFEHCYAPYAAFAEHVLILHWRLYPNHQATTLLGSYMQHILKRHFHQFGFEKNSFPEVNFNVLITEMSCFFELPDCIKEAKKALKNFRDLSDRSSQDQPFPIDLREIFFCYAIKNGNTDDFQFLLDASTKTSNVFEKNDILSSLYCTKDESLIQRIPTSRRVSRHAEHKMDSYFKYQKEKGSSPNIDKPMFRTLEPEIDGTTTPIPTDTSEESSTSMETTTIEDVTTSDSEINTSDLTEETTPSSFTESSAIDESRIDPDEPDLEKMILRSKFGIVSDIFYKTIKNMVYSKKLRCIWLFTQRINKKADLIYFKNFFEESEEFHDVKDQISERVRYVEQVFEWQKKKTGAVVRALQKNLKRGAKSNASDKRINYFSRLFIISLFLILLCNIV